MNIKQMLDFEDLETSLQKQIIDICEDDEYNLDPKTLYRNIFNSKGDIQTLSKVFEVAELLIIQIKEEGVDLS